MDHYYSPSKHTFFLYTAGKAEITKERARMPPNDEEIEKIRVRNPGEVYDQVVELSYGIREPSGFNGRNIHSEDK